MEAFTQALQLRRYALYVFDYGAPVGFRLAMAHPERVTARDLLERIRGDLAFERGLSDAAQ